jgi:hypothetical protein
MVGGAAIAGVLLHANYLDQTEKGVSSASSSVGVGIDGSVFKNVPLFRRVPRPLVCLHAYASLLMQGLGSQVH